MSSSGFAPTPPSRGVIGTGMNVATNPFLGLVVDGLMNRVGVANALVGLQFVGVNRGGVVINYSLQESLDVGLAVVLDLAEPELSPALNGTQDRGLVGPPVEPLRQPIATVRVLGGLELPARCGG